MGATRELKTVKQCVSWKLNATVPILETLLHDLQVGKLYQFYFKFSQYNQSYNAVVALSTSWWEHCV